MYEIYNLYNWHKEVIKQLIYHTSQYLSTLLI